MVGGTDESFRKVIRNLKRRLIKKERKEKMKQIVVKKELAFDADVFIIPDPFCTLNSMHSSHEIKENVNRISEMNGCGKMDPDEDFIMKLCYVSKDLKTENLCKDGGYLIDRHGCERKFMVSNIDMLPADIFMEARESISIDIEVPCTIHYPDADVDDEEIFLKMHLIPAQRKYTDTSVFQRYYMKLRTEALFNHF